MKAAPETRELIIFGGDRHSIVTADPEDQLFGIRPGTLDRIAVRTTLHSP